MDDRNPDAVDYAQQIKACSLESAEGCVVEWAWMGEVDDDASFWRSST